MAEWRSKPWRPSVFLESPLYWPILPAAKRLEHLPQWPSPADLCALFGADAPVRFELAEPAKPRRSRRDRDRERAAARLYDERIVVEGVVPTRAGSWHDLLNALVWVTFPRAKLALHARQHRMIQARRNASGSGALPSARTPEQDAVAMFDEGGAVVLRSGGGGDASGGDPPERVALFGHGLYEVLICGGGPERIRAAAYVVTVPYADVDAALGALFSKPEPIERGDFGAVIVSRPAAAITSSALPSLMQTY